MYVFEMYPRLYPAHFHLQGGYQQMVRAGSVGYGMDDGYVPDYHTGRRYSSQYDQVGLKWACFSVLEFQPG